MSPPDGPSGMDASGASQAIEGAWVHDDPSVYPTYEDSASAWAIQSDEEDELDSEEEGVFLTHPDWDVYRDFNNMNQMDKHEFDVNQPVPQRDKATLPSRRLPGGIPPRSARPTVPHLVSFPDFTGMYPTAQSNQHMYNMQQSSGDVTRGHSFASDDAKPFAHDLDGSTLELAPLGAEFTEQEHEQMTRRARRKRWAYSKMGGVRSWAHGENPLCGWFGPRAAVFITFTVLALLGITLYFVIPRVPSVELATSKPLTPAGDVSAMNITAQPAGFFMNGTLTMRFDNSDGWIPSRLTNVHAIVKYKPAKTKVGEGSLSGKSIPGRTTTKVGMPIHFNYHSINSTGDDTQLAFQKACAHPCMYFF